MELVGTVGVPVASHAADEGIPSTSVLVATGNPVTVPSLFGVKVTPELLSDELPESAERKLEGRSQYSVWALYVTARVDEC
jgi:hypothetical protein